MNQWELRGKFESKLPQDQLKQKIQEALAKQENWKIDSSTSKKTNTSTWKVRDEKGEVWTADLALNATKAESYSVIVKIHR